MAPAKADTISFALTSTQHKSPHALAVSSFAHDDSPVDPSLAYVPPTLTTLTFDYPSRPAAPSARRSVNLRRHAIDRAALSGGFHVDLPASAAPFSPVASQFTIFTSTHEAAGSFGYSVYKSGAVAYTYVTDPYSHRPRPSQSTPH